MIKNLLMFVAAIAVSVLFTGESFAGIKDTKHDFSSTSTGTTYKGSTTRMCVFCHTPHNAVLRVPLWNRSAQTSTYKLYTSSSTLTSETKKASEMTSDHISFKCLSCHDGTIAIGGESVVNDGGTGVGLNVKLAAGATTNLSTDLTDDHPIGFDYSKASLDSSGAGGDDYIKLLSDATAAGMKFYNAGAGKTNQMECASCHDVHNNAQNGKPRFLRTTLKGSALCLGCHIK